MRLPRVALALLAGALAAPSPATELPGVDELLARSLEARGGREAWKAVQAFQIRGQLDLQPGVQAPFTLTVARPGRMRLEFRLAEMTAVQAYDGEDAWMVLPFTGSDAVNDMPEDLKRQAADQADLEGPLVDPGSKGHVVTLVGRASFEGRDCYELDVQLASGERQRMFLDAETFLQAGVTGDRTANGVSQHYESVISDYRDVEGLTLAHHVENRTANGTQTISIESISVNPAVDQSLFARPAAEP
jgi:outer membrane lipoprotein-sorting protein